MSESEEEFTFEDNEEGDEDYAASPSPKRSTNSKKKVIDEEEDDDDDDFVDSPKLKKVKKQSGSGGKSVSAKRKLHTNEQKKATKKVKTEKKTVKVKEESESLASPSKGAGKPKTLKKLDKTERLEYAMQSFLWWDAPEPPEGYQWNTMEHTGVSFADPYIPHKVQMKYNGQPVELTPDQEEAATFFAAMDPNGMNLGNPKTAKIFIKNFFQDFKDILGKKHVIQKFDLCDFSPIREFLNQQKIVKKAISDMEKQERKEDKNQKLHKFGFAIVDGHIERVGE